MTPIKLGKVDSLGRLEFMFNKCIFNPRRACAARVTVLGLYVCLSTTILALQAMQARRRLMRACLIVISRAISDKDDS